jgi:hypothetical protein
MFISMSILNNTAIKNLVGVLKEGFPFENNKKSVKLALNF